MSIVFTYAQIARRPICAVCIQRTYKHRFESRTSTAIILQRTWRCAKIRRVPWLPVEMWLHISSLGSGVTRAVIRSLCSQNTSIPSRIKSPTCGICGNEQFIPVTLRFSWSGVVGNGCDDSGMCSDPKSTMCLRCARAWVEACCRGEEGFLQCPSGCCRAAVKKRNSYGEEHYHVFDPQGVEHNFFTYMGYGTWPRSGRDAAHDQRYEHMTWNGEGNCICNRCKTNCYTIRGAIKHVRDTCWSNFREKRMLRATCKSIMSSCA